MRWPVRLYHVSGRSMVPTFGSGDVLLGWRWFKPRVGRVVVARADGRPLVKRIVRLEDGLAWLEGDNPAHSTDSRHFGPLPVAALEAIIIKRM